jgi:hypothetical protein
MDAAKKSPGIVREEFRTSISGTTPASGGTRLTAEQAAKLPPDTAFVGMDGVARRTHK